MNQRPGPLRPTAHFFWLVACCLLALPSHLLAQNVITPVSVITTSFWDNAGLGGHKDKMINGQGLSGGGSVLAQVHDNNSNVNSWHAGAFPGGIVGGVTGTPPYGAPPPVNTQAVEFDLGANYNLSAAHIWNFNGTGSTGRGVKDVAILVSSSTTGAFSALTTTQFTQATGLSTLAAQVVPLTGATNVRRVRFAIQSVWSGLANDYVGLSEVRFQAPLFSLPPTVQVPPGETWSLLAGAPAQSYGEVVSSGDGSKLLAASGHIYSSADSGVTWTKRRFFPPGVPPEVELDQPWSGLAMSVDGGKVFATSTGNFGGWLLSSDDLGANWTVRDNSLGNSWTGVACSNDGTKVVAIVDYKNGGIFTSTNSGQTFTPRNIGVFGIYQDVASSADGTKLVVVEYQAGLDGRRLWTSADSGQGWVQRTAAGLRDWRAVATSADGTMIAAVVSGGKVYVSANSGDSWTERLTDANRAWTGISLSADGTRMAATVDGGQIYLSNNSGVEWLPQASTKTWRDLAYNSTGAGTRLIAAASDGLHSSVSTTIPYTVTVNAGSGPASVPSVATALSGGQAVAFHVTNSNNALFSVQPAISAAGTLTFTPALITGTATVTVRAQDAGGVPFGDPQTFVITIPVDSIGTWSTAAWTNDGSSGIVPGQMLWARRFGSSTAATINGTSLTGVAATPHTSAEFDLTGPPNSLSDSNNLTSGSGGSATVAQNFFWGGDTQLTLKGLTAGQPYVLTMLSVGWEADLDFRTVNFGSGSDVLRVDQSQFGLDQGLRVEYTFTPTTATRAVKVAQANANDAGFHLYGLSLRLGGASVNAPITDISLGNNVVAENGTPGATVGAFSATDADLELPATYEFVAGTGSTDNAAFALDENVLKINAAANFEVKSSYSIRVRATDGGFPSTSFEKAFVIVVTNINEPPADVTLDNAIIAEGSPVFTTLGTFATVGDPDTNPRSHRFALVSGPGSTDNNAFRVVGDFLQSLVVPDLETQPTYSIRIRTTDSADEAFFLDKVFTITVVNVNERPTITNIADATTNEDQTTPAIAFTVGDPELPAANLTVTATSSNTTLVPNSAVVLGGSGASRTVTATPVANLSGTSTITVNVSDGVFNTTDTFVLTVNAVNDVPSFTLGAGAPYTRYLGAGVTSIPSVIASSSAGPEEASQTLSFPVTNTNNALFSAQPAISPSGTLTYTPLATANPGSATLSVRVQDNGGTSNGGVDTSAVQTFVINLLKNTAPTDISLSSTTLAENNAPGATVGILTATDANPGEGHRFSLVAGTDATDNAAFTITDAALTIKDGANFEAKNSYRIRIRATDTGEPPLTIEEAFIITVTNANDTPSDLILSRTSFPEERGPGDVVATLSTADQDAGQRFTYSLAAGTGSTDNAAFAILGNELKTADNVSFETKSSFAIRLRVTDDGSPPAFFEKAFPLAVTNVNEAPTDIVLSTTTWMEAPWQGNLVATNLASLSAVDPEPGQTHTFAMAESSGDDDNGRFRIVSIGNTPWLQTSSNLDFEEKNLLKVRVRATDKGSPAKSFIKVLSLPITNRDDPLFLDSLVVSQRPGSKLVDIGYSLRDEDAGTTVPVSLQVSSDGGATWTIPVTSATGDLGAAVAPGSLTYLANRNQPALITAAAARNITWNGATNWNEQVSTRMRVRLTSGALTVTSSDFTLDTRGDGNLTLSGRVLSRTTSLPLAGVGLRLGTRTATTATDGTFTFNNAAPGTISLSLVQYLSTSIVVPTGSANDISRNLGDLTLYPDSPAPAIESITPDVNGIILAGFGVSTPVKVKINWSTGTPGSVKIWIRPKVGSNRTLFQTFTGAGPVYTTNPIAVDSTFAPSFDPKDNVIEVEAVNALGVPSSQSFTMSVIPVPAQIAAKAAAGAYKKFPAPAVNGVTPPINHLGFEYGVTGFEHKVRIPEIGTFGYAFGTEGNFDYTISDANFENAFVAGDLGLFGGQFRKAKQFSRPGNAFDVDGDRPKMELYLGPRTITGTFVSRNFGSATAGAGIQTGDMQLALAMHDERLIAEYYTLDLIPPLRATPKPVKKIFGKIAVIGKVGLDGSGTMEMVPKPRIKDATVAGLIGVKAQWSIDAWLAEASVWVGGDANIRIGTPDPLLREVGVKFQAGYSYDITFYDDSDQVTIGEWRYTAPAARQAKNMLVEKEHTPNWKPMRRTWRDTGGESFLQSVPATVQKSPLGARSVGGATTSSLSPELAAFNRMGVVAAPGAVGPRSITSDPTLPAQATLPLLDNVFPKAKPSLAERNGKQMLVYVRDTGAANPVQFTEIAYTYYDGTTWTTPGPVAADPRAQLEPQVKFDGAGNAVAVWSRVKDPAFAGTTDPAALDALLEIVSAVWSPTTRTWSAPVALTDNAMIDSRAELGGTLTDGDLMAVWVRNESNARSGSGAPGAPTNDQFITARWDTATSTWGTPTVINGSITNDNAFAFEAKGATAAVAWVQDMDGEFEDFTDSEVWAQTWNGTAWSVPMRVTTDALEEKSPRLAIDDEGRIYLLWLHGTDMLMSVDFSGTRTVVRADCNTTGFSDMILTANATGNLMAMWQERDASGPNVHFRVYDPASSTWGLDDRLSDDASLEKSLSPVWDSAGNLVVAYNDVEIELVTKTATLSDGSTTTIDNVPQFGRNDLLLARRRLTKDLSFAADSLSAEGASFLPGSTLTLAATLHNTGNFAIQNPVVGFYLGDPASGGTLIGSQTITGWFRAAEERVLTQNWVIPAAGPSRPVIYAVVDHAAVVTEFDETNNKLSIPVGGPDLELRYRKGTVLRDGSVRVTANVANIGSPASPVTELKLWSTTNPGTTPLTATTVSRLLPGQSVDVVLDLPAGFHAEGDQSYRMAVNEEAANAEASSSNNDSAFTLTLWIDDDNDGLPAGWEAANGQSDSNATDGNADSDGDGFTNRQEYLAGTNPRDRTSVLKVGDFFVQNVPGSLGHLFTISWASVAGKSYVVERSFDLSTWSPIATGVPATAPLNTMSDQSTQPRAYYRVRPQ